MVKSTIVTGKALLTSISLAMRGTCNSLIVLGSFSDGLSVYGLVGKNGQESPLSRKVLASDALTAQTVTKSPARRDLRDRENVTG